MIEVDYRSPKDWPSFTFHRYLEEGLYPANRGGGVSFSSGDFFRRKRVAGHTLVSLPLDGGGLGWGWQNNMKQLKSSLSDLSELFERSITVREIAEPLASFDVNCSIDVVKKFMNDKDFDVTGVRENGLICGYYKKSDLSRGKLEIINFQDDEKFSETTPLINVLKAFKSLERIFVFVLGEVGGIVTRGDLQKSPVRMWLFGLISLIEMQTVRIIRDFYPNDSWMENILDKQKKSIEGRFKQYRNANAEIDRAECLNLHEKGEIIINDITILKKLDIKKEQYDNFFENLKNLRIKVAHQQNIITKDWPGNIDLVRKAEDFLGKCENFENK